MSNRVRLTRRQAADGSIPYPGNVNQPGRTDPAWDQYHTFEQTVNHELPDMRTEWKNDSRDDIGFGIPEANPPTVASVRVAANKAVRIAVLLLGEKVSDSVIEAQARDLMTLGGEAMDRTLDRFAKTQSLYKADDDCDADDRAVEAKTEVKASAELADKGKAVPEAIKSEEKVEEKPAEVKPEEKPVEAKTEVKAEEKKMPDFIQEKIDEKKEKEEKKAADEVKEDDKVEARLAKLEGMIASLLTATTKTVKAEEKVEEKKEEVKAAEEVKEEKVEAKKSSDDADADDEVVARKAGPNEMDIELTSSMDDAIPADPAADAQLASLFADGMSASDDEDKDDAEKTAKSKKAGIKKLGGQPKVAAQQGAGQADISSIWESAPDVSEVFR